MHPPARDLQTADAGYDPADGAHEAVSLSGHCTPMCDVCGYAVCPSTGLVWSMTTTEVNHTVVVLVLVWPTKMVPLY